MFRNLDFFRRSRLGKWVRKIGIWGFLFFLTKGLVWLAIGYLATAG